MADVLVKELEWKTNRDKTLQVIRTDPYGFLKFQFLEGGPLPKELTGNYTAFRDIKIYAERWIEKQPKKPYTQIKKEAAQSKTDVESQTIFADSVIDELEKPVVKKPVAKKKVVKVDAKE